MVPLLRWVIPYFMFAWGGFLVILNVFTISDLPTHAFIADCCAIGMYCTTVRWKPRRACFAVEAESVVIGQGGSRVLTALSHAWRFAKALDAHDFRSTNDPETQRHRNFFHFFHCQDSRRRSRSPETKEHFSRTTPSRCAQRDFVLAREVR